MSIRLRGTDWVAKTGSGMMFQHTRSNNKKRLIWEAERSRLTEFRDKDGNLYVKWKNKWVSIP